MNKFSNIAEIATYHMGLDDSSDCRRLRNTINLANGAISLLMNLDDRDDDYSNTKKVMAQVDILKQLSKAAEIFAEDILGQLGEAND